MENHHSCAAPPNAKGSSAGSQENKDVAVPNLSPSAEVAAIVATSNDEASKGKSVAADNKELKPHMVTERNRWNRMKNYYGELQALMPQVPPKSDKATIVGYTIEYIKYLEKKKAMLEKRKQERDLARQAAAEAVASSSSVPPPPLTAQDMALAAMSSDVPGDCSVALRLQPTVPVPMPQLVPATMSSDVPQPLQQPLAAVEPAPAPPQRRNITAQQAGFQTWSWPNLVLSVSDNTAFINVCAPRQRGMWTKVMVLSVLHKYGIEVVTGQINSDAVCSIFNIYVRVTAMGGENPSAALEVYKLAVSEILVWLTTS